jgi:hypothetical protein
MFLMAAYLARGGTPDEETWESLRARIETSPQEVATFIERRTGCNHFWGEVGSGNAEREQQIGDALGELRCAELEADEDALRDAHHDEPEVLKLLDDTKDLLPW